ncbi:sodium/calcium exchange protein, putative [Bodo saltans]|uniref:Sodium/calcium exchange protein, putative n=1 Tax=Bodo saltans TaxID=75058 RepID=A0A0S4IUP6_BODSA|nr:sodium/calcium exchange protein, putative [Bodo saltans]|eukprot:CUF98285.1 sodium/calcium exchange protein, putative [Bodo saltans]
MAHHDREMEELDKTSDVIVPSDETAVEVRKAKRESEPSGPPPLFDQLKEIAIGSKLNILYLFIPVAILSGMNDGPGALTFASSFFALIPLAALLGDLTEDLADQTNDAIGALINVTFGNITEVIVGFAALRLKQYDLIQMTMLGSVFGNMLLVLGSSLLIGGLKAPMLSFNGDAVKTYIGLLLLGCMGTVIPTAFSSLSTESGSSSAVQNVSAHVSLVLMVFYFLYLFFQLRTHKSMFDGEDGGEDGGEDDDDEEGDGPKFSFIVAFIAIGAVAVLISIISDFLVDTVSSAAKKKSLVLMVFYFLYLFFQLRTHKSMFDGEDGGEDGGDDDDEEGEGPKFSFIVAFVAIGAVAVLISIISDFLVDTVSSAADTFHLSRHFIGLVIIPIVGNVAEHASAIIMAAKGKIDIAFGVALGSSIQIQMFAFPLLAVASWVMGLDMDMNVTPFLAATLFVCVIVTYSCVFDSSATWLQGAKLLCAYLLLALAFLDAPDPATTTAAPTTSKRLAAMM